MSALRDDIGVEDSGYFAKVGLLTERLSPIELINEVWLRRLHKGAD